MLSNKLKPVKIKYFWKKIQKSVSYEFVFIEKYNFILFDFV